MKLLETGKKNRTRTKSIRQANGVLKIELLEKYPGLIFTTSTGMSYLPVNAEDECERIKNIVNKQESLVAKKEGREAEMLEVTPHSFVILL